jgi:hypothetical protein
VAGSGSWRDVVVSLDAIDVDVIAVDTSPADLAAGGIRTAKVLLSHRPPPGGTR